MRTSSLIAACGVALLGSSAAFALDAAPRPQPLAPTIKYGSAREALRNGMRDYNAGDKQGAALALEYAAGQGHTLALWKLGRMYADGDGVEHDDLKAFEYFSKLADQNADESPDSPNARRRVERVRGARHLFPRRHPGLLRLGQSRARASRCSTTRRPISAIRTPSTISRGSISRAPASTRISRLAARWFNLAAEKGHHASQALLGHLLITGNGVPRQRAKGLMWLTLARESMDPAKDQWIGKLYDEAFAGSGESDRKIALDLLEQYIQARR